MCALPLLWIPVNSLLFILIYLLCGITDVLDGYLARKFGAFSPLGAKLDSLGDFIFWMIVLYRFVTRLQILDYPVLLAGIVSVFLLRVANLLFTKWKFRQWGMLHTLGNKATGGLLFFALPAVLYAGHVPLGISLVAVLPSLAAAAEEMLILLTSQVYQPDWKSIFCLAR